MSWHPDPNELLLWMSECCREHGALAPSAGDVSLLREWGRPEPCQQPGLICALPLPGPCFSFCTADFWSFLRSNYSYHHRSGASSVSLLFFWVKMFFCNLLSSSVCHSAGEQGGRGSSAIAASTAGEKSGRSRSSRRGEETTFIHLY